MIYKLNVYASVVLAEIFDLYFWPAHMSTIIARTS